MVFISKMVTSVSSPHKQKVRRQQGIARRRETSWRALAGLRNRHGQVSEPKSPGKEKVCPGTASKPRPTQVCGILSCRPLALPTFLWEAVLLLSKYRGLNTVSSFHPLSFSQAHMARRGPFFESGPSHPTKQKQVNWFDAHQRGCFLWLAFLRLLSFSSFRNGWVITPPFQVSSFVPGSIAQRSDLSQAFTSIWHFSSRNGVTWDYVKRDERKKSIFTLAWSWPRLQVLKLQPKGSESLGFVIWTERPNGFLTTSNERARNVDAVRKEEVKIQKTLRN